MRVKVTFVNGTTMFGNLHFPENTTLGEVMNDGAKFFKFEQPSGKEVLMSKSSVAYIVQDEMDDL
jgi:hypothetical protein